MPTFNNFFNSDHLSSQLLGFLNNTDRHNLGLTSRQINADINQPTPRQKIYLSRIDFETLVRETSDFIKSGRLLQNAHTIRGNFRKLRKLVEVNNGTPPVAINEIKYEGDEKYLVFAFIFGLEKLSTIAYQHCHSYMNQNPNDNLSLALSLTDTKPINKRGVMVFIDNIHNRSRTKIALMFLDLRGADFSFIDLSCRDLSFLDLSGANISGANLVRANLSGANLSGANISGSNLERANLSGTNFSGADLRNANLADTNFTVANFSDANLSCTRVVSTRSLVSILGAAFGVVTFSLDPLYAEPHSAPLWLAVAFAVLSGACLIGVCVQTAHRSLSFQRLSTPLSPENENDNPVIDLENGYQRL